jgi:hypothetical protein
MMFRKGQTGIEMLMSISFALFILIIIALFASERNRDADQISLMLDAKRVGTTVADNINNIAEQGTDFYRYFSLPDTIYGSTDYNISVYENFIEISAGDYVWATQTVSSNVTIFCLDTGGITRNKVYNEQDRIYVICNKPELRILNRSMFPDIARTNRTINLRIKLMNFGPVESGSFKVSFNHTQNTTIGALRSDGITELGFLFNTSETPGQYPVEIWIDTDNTVNESIESNNFFNGTLYVV